MKVVKRTRLRLRRKRHVRKQLRRAEAPLLTFYRSNKHIYAQIVDPMTGRTLTSVSTLSPSVREGLRSTKDKEAAKRLGQAVAASAIARDIRRVSFNRNGFVYTGRVRILADAAREAGLEF